MRCPQCDSLLTQNTGICSHCKTQFVPKRIRLNPSEKDFVLQVEENETDRFDDSSNQIGWTTPASAATARQKAIDTASPETYTAPWGGFMRRACAFIVDGVMISLLGSLMLLLAYVGYKVGLTAHGKSLTVDNSQALAFILTLGWIGLSAGYFVILHGSEGQTIGKWLLGLRVVGAERGAVTHGQAFTRWLAAAALAPLVLGFLWIIWSREKRAWHDIVAGTWVIRDWT